MDNETHHHQVSPLDAMSTVTMIVFIVLIGLLLPVGYDWNTWHINTHHDLLHPYTQPDFAGTPFAYFLLPHAALPVQVGAAINLALNIITIILVARWFAPQHWLLVVAMVFTAPTGIILIMSNNIDWIPLAAFIATDGLAYPMLLIKPQTLACAAVIRFKRNPHITALIPLACIIIASVLIWGAWWGEMGDGLIDVPWNFAVFPFGVPAGMLLLYRAWCTDDEVLAACSTVFFMPYAAPYSFAGLHVLVASKHPKVGAWWWLLTWWFVIIEVRRLSFI